LICSCNSNSVVNTHEYVMMEDDNEESSITERSIIANAIYGQNLVVTVEAEDDNQAI
jgi:hypothetical protein